MALSNIGREPRREITETLVGLAIVGALLGGDVWFGIAAHSANPETSVPFGMFAGLVMLIVAGLALLACALLVIGVHFVGELVCDRLQGIGVHLRPVKRIR